MCYLVCTYKYLLTYNTFIKQEYSKTDLYLKKFTPNPSLGLPYGLITSNLKVKKKIMLTFNR